MSTQGIPATPNPFAPLADDEQVPAPAKSAKQKKRERQKAKKAADNALAGVTHTAPATSTLPAPIVAPSGPGGLGIALTQSTQGSASDTASALGGLTRKDSEYVFHYDDAFLEWTPKGAKRAVRYAVALDIPLKKPRSQYTPNELALAAKEFADIWIADVTARLHADGCPLTPGQEIKALFEGKEGYLLFHPKDGLDPRALTTKEITERTATIKADSAEAKALSTLVDTCKPETFREQLTQPVYDTLRRDATTKTDKAGDAHPPSNLVNTGASCFVNSPFLNLVRNRGITQELRNPKNFVNGAQNPLYKAIKGYLDHQASGSKEKYSLGELAAELGIDDTRQDDVDNVWHMFSAQLNYSSMTPDSPLRSLFVDKLTIAPKAGISAQTLMQKAIGAPSGLHIDSVWKNGTHPKTFTVYVGGRSDITVKPLSELTDPEKTQIVDDLIAHKDAKAEEIDTLKAAFEEADDKDLCDDLLANADDLAVKVAALKDPVIKQLFNKLVQLAQLENTTGLNAITSRSSAAEKLALATALLADGTVFWNDSITKILTPAQRSRIGNARCPAATKVTTAVEKPLSVKISTGGKTTTYELMSFSSHRGSTGASGHYTTFERRGDQYWEIDDLRETSTQIDAAAFLDKAKTAAFCVYGTVGMSGGPEAASKPAGNEEIEHAGKADVGAARVIVEAGSLRHAGEDFVLVNPTDSALTRVDSQFGDACETMRTDLIAQQRKIVNERAAFWKIKTRWRETIDQSVGTTEELTHSGKDGKSLRVLHTAAGDWSKFGTTTEEDQKKIDEAVASTVKGALEKAESAGITKIAFPLIAVTGYSPERSYQAMRKAIDDYISSKKGKAQVIREVKIVVNEDQKSKIPALNTPVEKAEAAAVADMEVPLYQVGSHTTLEVDSNSPMPTSFANGSTGRSTLAQDLATRFGALVDKGELTVDLTCGDAAGPTTSDPKVMRVDIGHYGYCQTGVSLNDRFLNAIADFRSALEQFASTNSNKNIKITLKIPRGLNLAIRRYPVVGSNPTPVVPTSTTLASSPPQPVPIDSRKAVRKEAQENFMAPLNVVPQPDITVNQIVIHPVTTTSTTHNDTPLTRVSEADLMRSLATAYTDGNIDELVIDCRPGCKDQVGISALDMRHFDDATTGERMQRLRNFIGQFALQFGNRKSIKLILPHGMTLPERTKQLPNSWGEAMHWSTTRQSNHGAAPTAAPTA